MMYDFSELSRVMEIWIRMSLFEDDLGPGTEWIDEKQTIIEGK